MTAGIWVLGDRLWLQQAALSSCVADCQNTPVILIESRSYARDRPYHRQKLVLVWSAMRHFGRKKQMKLLNKLSQSPYFSVVINFSLGVTLSTIASVIVWNLEQGQTKSQFEREIDNITHTLQYNLENYTLSNKLLGGLYEASGKVTAEGFQRFAYKIFPAHPGILTIGWSPRVTQNQRLTYEQQTAPKNSVDFKIEEHNDRGLLVTAEKRDEYYPITHIESTYSKLRNLIGYDLASEKQHRTVIEKAKKKGNTVLARHFFLGHNSTDNFVMYQPVYESKAEFSPPEKKREFLRGVVYIVFQPSVMVKKAIEGMKLESIDFYIYNSPTEKIRSFLVDRTLEDESDFMLFYDHNTRQVIESSQQANFLWSLRKAAGHNYCPYDKQWNTCLRTVYVAGEQWSIVFMPKEEFYVRTERDALATLLLGLFATATLTIYLWMSIKQNIQTERLVVSLTEEVKEIKANYSSK